MNHRRLALVAASILCFALPLTAQANGAFPAPFRIFAPEARPDEMIVTTNYGILETLDSGRAWSWSCEHHLSEDAYLYQQAPTGRRMLAISILGLAFTDDGGCSWNIAPGQPDDAVLVDYFVDQTPSNRVFGIVRRNVNDLLAFSLVVTSDGGSSFPSRVLYQPAPGTALDSIEVARSDANTVYVTLSSVMPGGPGPRVARSQDGGASFVAADPAPGIEPGILRIATIDPVNPLRLFLRLEGPDKDVLYLSEDGGRTVTKMFAADSGMALSAFLLRQDGTIFVAAIGFDGAAGRVHRSTDRGKSFVMVADGLHVGSLVERSGTLYVLANGTSDAFLVGVSRDNAGSPFQPLVRSSDVKGVKACAGNDLRPLCSAVCSNLGTAGLFSSAVCTTLAPSEAVDAGAVGDGAVDGAAMPARDSGGSCSLVLPPRPGSWGRTGDFIAGAALVALLTGVLASRRRSKGRGERGVA